MNHHEKLNQAMISLLFNEKAVIENNVDPLLTFKVICKSAGVDEDWEVEYLRKILLEDGYMEMGRYGDGEPPRITHKGYKFWSNGGYVQEKKDNDTVRQLAKANLRKVIWDVRIRWLVFISIVLGIISLVIQLLEHFHIVKLP